MNTARKRSCFAAIAFVIVAGTMCDGALAATKHKGTAVQRRACEPDVWRLCARHIPWEGPITECLKRNNKLRKLSRACHLVFEGKL